MHTTTEKPPIAAAFSSGSFQASNGIEIPCRFYFPPDIGENEELPLFFHMHGNGSRGADNERQLTTVGGALIRKCFAENRRCVYLAPQCIRASQWVNVYPGDGNYTPDAPQNPYYAAAWELFLHFAEDKHIDKRRIYISGGSNGGGATLDLCCRHPDVFAAAVPMAPTGRSGTFAPDIAAPLLTKTPLWIFHGTADAALTVESTRALVAALRTLGAPVRYTEVEGATHGNIWQIAAETPGVLDWMFAQTK